jgi:4'-phosphopantetheinyl transferase
MGDTSHVRHHRFGRNGGKSIVAIFIVPVPAGSLRVQGMSKRAENLKGNSINMFEYKGAIQLDARGIAMHAIPPPLRPWSENVTNRCLFEEIPAYWEAHDVITFLAHLGMYHPSLYELLDNSEKEQERRFKTEYFKKRFTISRGLLKHILKPVLGADQPSDILLGRETKGRLHLPAGPDISLSLSYSGPYIAITLGKQKTGSDIEVVRPVKAGKIVSSQIFINYQGDSECLHQVIHVWTLVESCAKLFNENPYSLLNSCAVFKDANFVSYCINNHLILSLASGKKQFTDALVWLDSHGPGEASGLPVIPRYTAPERPKVITGIEGDSELPGKAYTGSFTCPGRKQSLSMQPCPVYWKNLREIRQ